MGQVLILFRHKGRPWLARMYFLFQSRILLAQDQLILGQVIMEFGRAEDLDNLDELIVIVTTRKEQIDLKDVFSR